MVQEVTNSDDTPDDISNDSSSSDTVDEAVTEDNNTDYLESLSDYAIGDIIDASLIDTNNIYNYFTINTIDNGILNRINGKSYRDNPNITTDELRYIKLIHYDFNGNIKVGELIVNVQIANDIRDIFVELFQAKYQIQSMILIDDFYDSSLDGVAADNASMDANNTSAFNYRNIAGTSSLSNHALGMAIDINPYYNPYFTSTDEAYYYRSNSNGYDIINGDVCYNAFVSRGFTWGGDWETPKDYMHFEMI